MSSPASGCEILDLTSSPLMEGHDGGTGRGVGHIGYNKMGGEAAWNVVSVEVVTLNPPGRHLKLLPGSFFPLNVASALFFFCCLPTTQLPFIISYPSFFICPFLTLWFFNTAGGHIWTILSSTGVNKVIYTSLGSFNFLIMRNWEFSFPVLRDTVSEILFFFQFQIRQLY